MAKYAYPALAQFPKSEKFAIVVDIKRCMDAAIDYTQYSTLAMLVGAPTATAIGFYAWKAKAENVIKIKNENPEATKDVPIDLNNINGTN